MSPRLRPLARLLVPPLLAAFTGGTMISSAMRMARKARRRAAEAEAEARMAAEKALQESQAILRAVTDSTPDPIFVKDRESHYIFGNPAVLRVWNRPLEEVLGKNDLQLYNDPAIGETMMQNDRMVMESGKSRTIEEVVEMADGDCRTYLSTKTPYRDESGEIIGIIGIARDITARKNAEERLRRTAEELARSNNDLEHFAYIAAHDLQEPLRTVRTFTQMLAKRCQEKLDSETEEYIHYIVGGAGHMSELIAGLLDYSRVSSAGRTFAPTDSREALAEALDALHESITTTGASITQNPLPIVNGDKSQLTQLFQNLIANAIKFRSKAAPPIIHVSACKQDGDWVFSVCDNGIGIDSQYQEKVFEIFRRLHGSQEYPGTGIGLALCKRIVERHGGRIWFESQPGQGTTFFFTLPKSRQ